MCSKRKHKGDLSNRVRREAAFRAVCAAGVIAALSLAGCKPRESTSPSGSAGSKTGLTSSSGPASGGGLSGRAGLNVVLVSVDTTRSDHLGCYGHPRSHTPNIDRLASEGTRFEQCISSAPLTLPSHASILTGSYPFVHGARDNGSFQLCAENTTLAEILKSHGYSTAAEVATVILNRKYGLDQGFEYFGDVSLIDATTGPLIYLDKLGKPGTGTTQPSGPKDAFENRAERNAEEITKQGIRLLEEESRGHQPFFIFLHYYDPHWPFIAPKPFSDEFPTDPYLAEIAYFDSQFGKFLEAMSRLGLDDKTLVILTSDHGESRGQHGEETHAAFLYDATLRVPLIMRCSGLVPRGQVVQSQVRLIDVVPTILELTGVSREFDGQIQGTSLTPLLANTRGDLNLVCYSDTIVPKTMYGYSPLRSLRTEKWKYILAPTPELYDLENDSIELFNLAPTLPNRPIEMRQELWDLIEKSPKAPCGRATLQTVNRTESDALQALGYVSSSKALQGFETGSELDHFEPQGANPRDHVQEIEMLCIGMAAIRMEQFALSESKLRKILEIQPDHRMVASSLVIALAAQKKYEEALTYSRRLVKEEPTDAIEWARMGSILAALDRPKEAAEALKKALEFHPDDPVALENLGAALFAQGKHQEAVAPLEKALALAPPDVTSMSIVCKLAELYEGMGQWDKSAEVYRKGVERDPKGITSRSGLARLALQKGNADEAIELLTKSLEILPDAAVLHMQLGQCFGAKNEPEKAIASAQRAISLDPKFGDAYLILGLNLRTLKRMNEAIDAFEKARTLSPNRIVTYNRLAECLVSSGQFGKALKEYETIIEKWPTFKSAYRSGSRAAIQLKDTAKAVEILNKAIERFKDDAETANDLAWILATSSDSRLRDGRRALSLVERFSALKEHEDPNMLDTLGAAYAEVGQFEKAVTTLDHAIELAEAAGNKQLIGDLQSHRELYKRGQPFRSQ